MNKGFKNKTCMDINCFCCSTKPPTLSSKVIRNLEQKFSKIPRSLLKSKKSVSKSSKVVASKKVKQEEDGFLYSVGFIEVFVELSFAFYQFLYEMCEPMNCDIFSIAIVLVCLEPLNGWVLILSEVYSCVFMICGLVIQILSMVLSSNTLVHSNIL